MAGSGFDFDLFVIGGGSGGVRAARMAAGLGARVALAEGAALGGTCVNVGCIPKKLYSFAAGYATAFEEAAGFGWQLAAQAPRLDWARLKAGVAGELARLNGVYRGLLERAGVTRVPGYARLDGAQAVVVGQQRYTAAHVLVATGGQPRRPDVPGHHHAVVSDGMFDLARLPGRLVVVGGGYIACEFASIFAGLGSQVTLVHRGARLLADFDEATAQFVAREMTASGVDIRLRTGVESLAHSPGDDQRLVHLNDGQALTADTVLYAIGRIPRTAGLGLEGANVMLDAGGAIVVDDHYRSTVPWLYAVGDVSSRKQLTPVATAEAMVVVNELYGGAARRVGYEYIPTAVFTHPQLASCGYAEQEARARFGADNIAVYSSDFKALRHSLSGRGERTFVKLLVHVPDDRVVGLHMVGEDAAEIVQGFAVAMTAGATKAHFDATLGIHPTAAEEFVTLRVATLPAGG
ncbi:MAG: glutathione-disulfide reductase [Ramlibacter sp.]